MQSLNGFSKLGISEKTDILKKLDLLDYKQIKILGVFHDKIRDYDSAIQQLSENYISNYALPFGIAPNFRINNKHYLVPMVTEESSVVAAACFAAKFWFDRGGFKTEVIGTRKSGQIYFTWQGDIETLKTTFAHLKKKLLSVVSPLILNMEKRGGGITGLSLVTSKHNKGYQILNVEFETADSMGANLINSCLEIMGSELTDFIKNNYYGTESEAEIIMAILSNFTPECLVKCTVECTIDKFKGISGSLTPSQFVNKFEKAVQIARENVQRAVTHNKGIFNGIDAVLLATGNDFRAVEACGHAWASRNGRYTSLTNIETEGEWFRYSLTMPIALGTVGGATSVHPVARLSLSIMQNPTARELMQIVASTGLASNFAAIRSLITDGIQKGHMKLHMKNILSHFEISEMEKKIVEQHFLDKKYSFKAVSDYIEILRQQK